MLRNYIEARNTVLKKYGINEQNYALYVCILYGMMQIYKGYEDLVMKAFNDVTIIINTDSMKEICKKNNIDVDENIYCSGLMIREDVPEFNDNGTIIHNKDGRKLLIVSGKTTPETLLNRLFHEFCHYVKSVKNPYIIEEEENKKRIISRSGLSIGVETFDYKKMTIEGKENQSLLDEAINCLQTSDGIQEIIALLQFVSDKKIKDFLESLNRDRLLQDKGYRGATEAVKNFWEIQSFKDFFSYHLIEGDLKNMNKELKENLGDTFFIELTRVIEGYHEESRHYTSSYGNRFQETINNLVNRWKEGFNNVYTYTDAN